MKRGESFRTTTIALQEELVKKHGIASVLCVLKSLRITASNEAKKEYMTDFDKRSKELNMDLLSAMKVLETLDNVTCKKCQRDGW